MFRSIKNWSCKTNAQLFSGPTEYRFVNLSQVHTRRHTQWIQNNIHRTSVFQEWHIFFTYDTGHDALVSVAACHLISYLQLPLLGNIDLGHLDDARRQLVTHTNGELFPPVTAHFLVLIDVVFMQQRRSVAHTYALKSLMLISYA